MSKHVPALVSVVLAGLVVAGCSGVPKGTAPQVSSQTTPTTGATSPAGASQSSGNGQSGSPSQSGSGQRGSGQASPGQTSSGQGGNSATDSEPVGVRQGVASKSFAKANSIPFPVRVGNTWVYQTKIGGASGRTTNRIVATGPGSAGYLVTMSSATNVTGASSSGTAGYTFYPDGTVGYPAPAINGVSVTGGGIRWPNAAALASGRAYHSTLKIQVGSSGQTQDAGVNVYGAGTETVTVPAGTYQASVVETTITAKGETIVVTTWIAQGVGTVKTQTQVSGAGAAGLTTTEELLSFTKAKSVIGDGS
ncbi:MAG TPA: hypothetical protein VFQ68_17290 [Streptosporangiaceae bacterium]|nr:hypothetical protein [Streptosporangiaceae bacterium]